MIKQSDKAAMLTLAYIFNEGNVFSGWSFYGANFVYDKKITDLCIKQIVKYGIDYKKSKIWDSIESSFLGTFTEETEKHIVMYAHIVIKDDGMHDDGMHFVWGCKLDEPHELFQVIAEMSNLDSPETIIKMRYNKMKN